MVRERKQLQQSQSILSGGRTTRARRKEPEAQRENKKDMPFWETKDFPKHAGIVLPRLCAPPTPFQMRQLAAEGTEPNEKGPRRLCKHKMHSRAQTMRKKTRQAGEKKRREQNRTEQGRAGQGRKREWHFVNGGAHTVGYTRRQQM